jgi:hypothetical protein
MKKSDKTFTTRCREFLSNRWNQVAARVESGKFKDPLLPRHASQLARIKSCLASSTKSYHYVLPTQVLCKCVDPALDCRSLQAAYGKPGAFDARTIAHEVIVPFDQSNHRVLGGSSEPYVNNPLRCPAVISRYRGQQKNKGDWDKLCAVLDAVEKSESDEFAVEVLEQILVEIYRLLAGAHVVYPTPNRVSLKQTIDLVRCFTAVKSGGDRIEAVCAALFRAIACEFRLFDQVRRAKVNAPDAASGMGADIECWFREKIALLVEVKDRSLTLTQLDAKLDVARSRKISEILFLAEGGIEKAESDRTSERIQREFASGQNIYVSNFLSFSAGILILLGERGRVVFLGHVGKELDAANSAIKHRQAWADLLKSF